MEIVNKNMRIIRQRTFITPEGRFAHYDIKKDPYNRVCFYTVFEDPAGYIIRNAFLPDFLQKKGISTRFYIQMNDQSMHEVGKPLRSTQKRTLSSGEVVHELTPAAVALWESLTRRGLVEKISEKNYKFKI